MNHRALPSSPCPPTCWTEPLNSTVCRAWVARLRRRSALLRSRRTSHRLGLLDVGSTRSSAAGCRGDGGPCPAASRLSRQRRAGPAAGSPGADRSEFCPLAWCGCRGRRWWQTAPKERRLPRCRCWWCRGRCLMVHLAATIPFGQPMSWEQFLEIPDDERAEYVDGKAFVSPPPGFAHQETCQRLRDVLKAQPLADLLMSEAGRR